MKRDGRRKNEMKVADGGMRRKNINGKLRLSGMDGTGKKMEKGIVLWPRGIGVHSRQNRL